MYRRCLYVSRALRPFSAAELYDIARVAQNRNPAHGVTGALLHADGYFAQYLEGDPFDVDGRIAVIRRDPRHTNFDVRLSGSITELMFPDHWMALGHNLTLDDPQSVALGYTPGFGGTLSDPETLLELFRTLAVTAGSET